MHALSAEATTVLHSRHSRQGGGNFWSFLSASMKHSPDDFRNALMIRSSKLCFNQLILEEVASTVVKSFLFNW